MGPEINRIAVVGHGIAFDARMRPIPMDLRTIRSMQASLEDVLVKARPVEDPAMLAFAPKVRAAIARSSSDEERTLLTGALIARRLELADKRLRETYGWRNRFLVERTRALLDRRFRGRYVLSDEILRLLRPIEPIREPLLITDYMSECLLESVPVPPNFSMASGSNWVNQGNLTYNILSPGNIATVWTFTDPANRGACVALPRDNGGAGSFAGIICQSATTGKACFWDNLTRDDPTRRIPTATETMVIGNLQDGRTLDEGAPCTECHTGNNVYLMSPDDPTWAKLMRGPLTAGNFTTIVEPQTNSPGGPRYTPIAHASWTNPPLVAGCAGVCHGTPSASARNLYYALSGSQRPPMPPACATGGNYRNCYAP